MNPFIIKVANVTDVNSDLKILSIQHLVKLNALRQGACSVVKNIIKNMCFGVLIGSLFTISGCASHKQTVRNSFLQVKKSIVISGCGFDAANKKEKKCAEFMKLGAVGSASIIWNDYRLGGEPKTLVLTADHVCHEVNKMTASQVPPRVMESFSASSGIVGPIELIVTKKILTLHDNNGTRYNTNSEPWLRNPRADICIIESSINRRALSIARKEPAYGEGVYNISAPYGMIFPNESGGAVYITEGLFAGVMRMSAEMTNRNMYTIWTAPGSSGSPIMNEKGELVGLVSSISTLPWSRMNPPFVSVTSAPSNVTFGPTLEDLRRSIDEAKAAMKRGRPYIHKGQEHRVNQVVENPSGVQEGDDMTVPPLLMYTE